jgi:hypothetical protein
MLSEGFSWYHRVAKRQCGKFGLFYLADWRINRCYQPPATVVVGSAQDQPPSQPWSAARPTKNQPSKKPSLLTILGLSSIRLRRRRQAKPNVKHCSVLKIEQHSCRLRRFVDAAPSSAPLPAVVHRRRCVAVEPLLSPPSPRLSKRRSAPERKASCIMLNQSAVEPVVADDAGQSRGTLRRHARLLTHCRNIAIELSCL